MHGFSGGAYCSGRWAQYVVWPSMLFGPVCCLAQRFVLYSVLLGNVLLGNLLRIIF